MDLPKLLTAMSLDTGGRLIDQKIKPLSISEKDRKKQLFNVRMVLDLDQGEIRFEPEAWQDGSEKEYYYLGNNSAAAAQTYAVREAQSFINYWTGRMHGIMENIRDMLPDGNTASLLQACKDAGLFSDTGLEFSKIRNWDNNVTIDRSSKKFFLSEKTYAPEKLLQSLAGLKSNQIKLLLIIPCIISNKKESIISKQEDYLNALESALQGGNSAKSDSKSACICHICGNPSSDIDTKGYSSNLSKSSVGKVFVTTQINYAFGFNKKAHQQNFAICRDCYQKWLSGEKRVMGEYRLTIANTPAVVLFDGISERLPQEEFYGFYKRLDAAFQSYSIQGWSDDFYDTISDNIDPDSLFEFHILFYSTDGKSCSVKKTIENISSIRFDTILDAFRNVGKMSGLDYFSLNTVYRSIPVRTNNKNEQLNIGRVLDFYSILFKGNTVWMSTLFEWYAEAMECGNRQLRAKEITNYKNLYYRKDGTAENSRLEWFFYDLSRNYLALFSAVRQLNRLEGDVFTMQEQMKSLDELPKILKEREEFLAQNDFPAAGRGLYYLGAMMYQIGEMQRIQEHKSKPILDKVSYSGMSRTDILMLHEELCGKTQQYRRAIMNAQKGYLTTNAERYLAMADRYLGNLLLCDGLQDEHANLFYLMSGYSSCILFRKKNDDTEGESDHAE